MAWHENPVEASRFLQGAVLAQNRSVAQVGDCCNSHNSLQHLARDFIDGQGHKHANLPNFPVVLANCTPCMQDGTGDMERIGMINQRGKTLEATLARGKEYGPVAYINTAHAIHGNRRKGRRKQSRRVIQESVIQFIRFIHSLNSLQPFIHTGAYNSCTMHTVNSQSDLVVKYTCFPKNTHPLFQSLSDGSKRPDEGRTDITYTALCPYRSFG